MLVIYVDLIILFNFLLDYSLIAYTGLIANEKIKFGRLLLASLFAVSGLLLFFVPIKIIFIILRLFYSFGIIYLAFPFVSLKRYLKNIVMFYFLNYLTAGIIISYDFQFSNNAISIDLNHATTWYLLLISFLFANIITYIYKVIVENNSLGKFDVLDVEFGFLNQDYRVKGLVDTGNKVTSYGDNLPIIFIDKIIFSDEINESYLLENKIKFTYVSINTINDNQLTLVFRPEYFGVVVNNICHEKEVYLAIGQNIKSRNHAFQAILNPNILF